MTRILYRIEKVLRRNAFLVATYSTFLFMRIMDICLGTNVTDSVIWTILWLTPVIYLEPKIRETFLVGYWVKFYVYWLSEIFTLCIMVAYLALIKFILYGTALNIFEVVLLLGLCLLYHLINVIRKMEGAKFFVLLFFLSALFATSINALLLFF